MTALISLMLAGAAAASGQACSEIAIPLDEHRSDVCDERFTGQPVYSVTFAASMTPRPALQQVTVYRIQRQWFVRVAGYRWVRGGAFSTRRNDIAISASDAKTIEDRVSASTIGRLADLPYYGSKSFICTDGSNLELAMASDGRRYSAAQHSCAGVTEMSGIAKAFGELALKYDPEFSGMLDGLTGRTSAAD